MRIGFLMAAAAAVALSGCGRGDGGGTANEALGSGDVAIDNSAIAAGGIENGSAPPQAVSGQAYADKAAAGDMFEIESAQIAQSRSKDEEVKSFAAVLLADHRKSTADLKAAAARAQPAIVINPAMDSEQQSNLEALRAAPEADFDRTFLTQQIAAHEKALAMIRGYAAGGETAPLKDHAASVSGPVEMHLNRARELSARPAG
jgi:putative membrane protein